MATKIIAPPALLSFPHFDNAYAMNEGDKKMFSAAFIWLKNADISSLLEAIVEAAVGKWGQSAIAKLKSGALKSPLSPGEKKGYPDGSQYTNARTERRPGLVYPYAATGTTKPALVIPGVIDPNYTLSPADLTKIRDTFYPGALVRPSLTAFAYDKNGNKGVSFGLNNVQLIDGTLPRLDGRKAADEEFEAQEGAMAPADLSDVEAVAAY